MLSPLALVYGCHKAQDASYQSKVRIVDMAVVRRDVTGAATAIDVSLDWTDCPGDQFESIRGGKRLVACMKEIPVGTEVPVTVLHHRTRDGYYLWQITQLGACSRPPDTRDESSFAEVQDCSSVTEHGDPVGFECQREPGEALLAKCPWFRVR